MAKWLDKYEQGGLVLKKKTKDNYGKKPNVNDVKVSAGPGFEGDGYTAQNWKSPAWGGQFQNGGNLPEKVLVHDPQDYEGGHRYALKKTITPYKTNQEIKKYTKATTNPEDIDFLHNYRHTADKTPSNATSTFVPYEEDKHWNIDRFITDPAFGKDYDKLNVEDNSMEAERRNVLADMFKYQMFQNPEQSRGKSFREAKRFVRNEIDTRVNGPYFQNYMRHESGYPVGTGGLTTFTNSNPFFAAWETMQGEEDPTNKNYRKNPWDDAKVEEVAKDYLKNTKKLSRKETREQIKKWKTESKSMIQDYLNPKPTPQTGGELTQELAMGGALPGAVGFMYARTQDPAPSNGKYTKKTLASAQTGISMNVESGTYQPTVTTATKAEIKKSAENAKKEKYYNPKKPTYKSGNKQIDFLASNPWLMDLPIIGDKIKEQAYALGTQKTGSIRTDEDIADPNKIDELRGKYLAGSTNDFSKPLDLVKQYIYADQKLPNSKFTPKDDYYDFLPSYSLQDKLEAPTNESLNMSNFGKENTSYKKGDEIIWNNDGSYFQGDKYKDLMDVVKTHKPKYYNSEKGNLPYDLFYKSGNLVDLAHYKSGFGYDEDVNLPYASISDAWDFYPGDYQKLWSEDKKGEDSSLNTREYQQAYLMHKVGNPYKIYDRTYIDPENKTLVNDKEILAKKQLKKSIDLIPGLTKEQKQKRYEQAWKLTGKSYNPNMKKGGVIKDDMGQWAHPGEVTEIGSNDITMQGVDYPVLGISDTGDTQMMYPDQDYKFDGEKVTEYPMMQEGGWLDKYPEPMRQDATRVVAPILKLTEREKLENAAKYDQGQKKALVNAKEELAERKKNKATKGDLNTPGSWHLEDKGRLSNILPASWAPPGGAVDVFDEYVNPVTYIGSLTDALGESIAARDPKGIAASLALSAGAGALGLDPLGGAIKAVKSFAKPSFTSGKEALDFLSTKVDDIGEENVIKIISKKTGKTRKQIEDEFNQAVGNADNPRDPEYIIRQANIVNGKFNLPNLPNFPKSLKELNEKAGKLVSKPNNVSFDKTEIINRANEILEKGVGVKKKNISVKLESTPGNVIEVKVNDNNPYFPMTDYNKSGYMNLEPNFHSIDTKSTTFTEWLQGKKPETRFVKNWGDFETEPAFTKIGDFPYDNRPDLKGTGVGAEAAEAMKQALEEKGIKLQSSTNHTQEGRLRYLTEFLNDRKKAINTEGNPGWIDVVNNIKESLKGKKVSKEEVQELMNLNPKIDPKAIRFQYKDGGWLDKFDDKAQKGKKLATQQQVDAALKATKPFYDRLMAEEEALKGPSIEEIAGKAQNDYSKFKGDNTRIVSNVPDLRSTEQKEFDKADANLKRAYGEIHRNVDRSERYDNRGKKASLNDPNSWHIEDKMRLFPSSIGGIGEVFDDYLNPLTMVGSIADGLGSSVARRDIKGAALSLGMAAGAGALGFDPLGSALKVPGRVAQSMESGLLSKAYKVNPWAFKPNSGTQATAKSFRLKDIADSWPARPLQSTITYLDERIGDLIKGTQNRKDIAEGNKWLQDWIEDPATQKKLHDQMVSGYSRANSAVGVPVHNANILYGENLWHAQNYKPRATEYPFANQVKDLGNDWLSPTNPNYANVHNTNLGVSYRHGFTPGAESVSDNSLGFLYDRQRGPGTWVSRQAEMNSERRRSVTIHEGVHDWFKDSMLNDANLPYKNDINNALTPEALEEYSKWVNNGYKGNALGYLADPTEVHARIMQARDYFNIRPSEKVTEEAAERMLNTILKGKVPVLEKKFGTIFKDSKSLANLFNKLPAVAPVAVGVGAAATALPKEQKNGGWLNKYK